MLHRFYRFLLANQVILALFIVILGWLLLQIRGIIMAIFLSYIFMAALLPAVEFLKRRKFPTLLAALLPFLGATVLIFLIIFPLIPFFVSQTQQLVVGLPVYLNESAKMFGFTINAADIDALITREFANISQNAISFTGKVFGGVFSSLTVIIVSFYLLLYYDRFRHAIAALFHKDDRGYVLETIEQVDAKLGSWLRGQLLLSFSIGLITWIFLSILGLPYALPLALLAGLLEMIPTLGPILAAIPAIIVALTISPTMGLTVVLIYIVIQLVENNFLVPKIMQRAVGLNPVIVILAVMIGTNLMGVLGALLSIPFISFLTVLFQSITANERK